MPERPEALIKVYKHFKEENKNEKQSSVLQFSHSVIVASHGADLAPSHLRRRIVSHHRRAFEGRRLQRSEPNAHMRLYDDLANGYYSTRVWIGTPPQKFALIVDTGSSVTSVPCSDCQRCGSHQDPRFQPNSSSTYQLVKCNAKSKGTYKSKYDEESSSIFVLAEDVISFGNETELVPGRAVFGCENVETGYLYSQHADGILGLGRDPEGPHDMVFLHSDPYCSPYYNIELKEIYVAADPLKLNPKVFDGGDGTVLDSGTTYAYLPKDAFLALKDSVLEDNCCRKLAQLEFYGS
ncbi:PREDICTED: aspartic [Prunus dulcis]|uniref:PREDICTED: aspartic n=1 Tax=Prunus dulcis TaxID=3755 RepID=A0A5E4EBL6_PRUDU|nr:PREDICTED: aspartic [Prunus dulcis]